MASSKGNTLRLGYAKSAAVYADAAGYWQGQLLRTCRPAIFRARGARFRSIFRHRKRNDLDVAIDVLQVMGTCRRP